MEGATKYIAGSQLGMVTAKAYTVSNKHAEVIMGATPDQWHCCLSSVIVCDIPLRKNTWQLQQALGYTINQQNIQLQNLVAICTVMCLKSS